MALMHERVRKNFCFIYHLTETFYCADQFSFLSFFPLFFFFFGVQRAGLVRQELAKLRKSES